MTSRSFPLFLNLTAMSWRGGDEQKPRPKVTGMVYLAAMGRMIGPIVFFSPVISIWLGCDCSRPRQYLSESVYLLGKKGLRVVMHVPECDGARVVSDGLPRDFTFKPCRRQKSRYRPIAGVVQPVDRLGLAGMDKRRVVCE